jgi:hypothetical protein
MRYDRHRPPRSIRSRIGDRASPRYQDGDVLRVLRPADERSGWDVPGMSRTGAPRECTVGSRSAEVPTLMASKRRVRAKSCEGKVRHETMAKAYLSAKKTGPDVHPYACRWCGKYHVGHEPGK